MQQLFSEARQVILVPRMHLISFWSAVGTRTLATAKAGSPRITGSGSSEHSSKFETITVANDYNIIPLPRRRVCLAAVLVLTKRKAGSGDEKDKNRTNCGALPLAKVPWERSWE